MRPTTRQILLGCITVLMLAAAHPATAQTKVWSIQLASVGWPDPYDDMTAQFKRENADRVAAKAALAAGKKPVYHPRDFDLGVIWPDELAVDSAGQVYLGFAPKRDTLDSPKSLRVVTLDPQTGALLNQADFPTPVWSRTAVLLAPDDTPIVVAGDKVQRFTKAGAIAASIPIPPQPKINPGLWVDPSPSGKTLLLTTDSKFFRFVSADTLATIAECSSETQEVTTINDHAGMGLTENQKNHQFEEHAGPFCGPKPLLWPSDNGHSTSIRLLDDDSVLEIDFDHVRRLTPAGKALWIWTPPQDTVTTGIGGIPISRNGRRVAVEAEVFHILRPVGCMECKGPESESWGVGVAVLDTATGRQVGYVPLDHAQQNRTAFALSPDGSRLAIMNAGTLEMWSIPK